MTRWDAHIERGTHDLLLHSPDDEKEPFAVFEMKRWMTSTGEREIPKIKKDIKKLQRLTGPAGFLIVFAANPPSTPMSVQLPDLERCIFETPVPPHEVYPFDTLYEGGRVQFWVVGWQISPPPGVAV